MTSIRETGAAAIWAAEHDMPCEWSTVKQADQEMYLRLFDAAITAFLGSAATIPDKDGRTWRMVPNEASGRRGSAAITAFLGAAAEEGWHMRPDEPTAAMKGIGYEAWTEGKPAHSVYRLMLAAAQPFEWGK